MAYVRLTKQVKDRIIDSSYSLFHNAIQKAKEALPEDFWQQCFDNYYDAEIDPYCHSINSKWLSEIKRINLTFIWFDGTKERYDTEYFKPVTKPRMAPKIINLVSDNNLTVPDDYQFPEHIIEIYAKYKTRLMIPEQEYQKFKKVKMASLKCL